MDILYAKAPIFFRLTHVSPLTQAIFPNPPQLPKKIPINLITFFATNCDILKKDKK